MKRKNTKYIIIHCSATPEGRDVKTETIRGWHIKQNKWKDIGYNYVIELDGSIHQGRAVDEAGAHTYGYNSVSVGICYVGGMDKAMKNPKDTRTDAQKDSLVKLIRLMKKKYPNAVVCGHRDFSNKACPSFDAKNEYKDL